MKQYPILLIVLVFSINSCTKQELQNETLSPSSANNQTKDTTLAGFDIALSMEEFKTQYKEKIKNCSTTPYKIKEISDTHKIDLNSCVLGNESFVTFAESNGSQKIYRLNIDYQKDAQLIGGTDVSFPIGKETLEKKTGSSSLEVKLYTLYGMIPLCGVETNFHSGTVKVLATALQQCINLGMTDNCRCTEKVWKGSRLHSIEYKDSSLSQSLDRKLSSLKAEDDQKKAKGFNL